MTIVLAEDQPLILTSLELLLSQAEDVAIVGTATRGDEALVLCLDKKPDVAVMDIRMPHMTGLEAARELKKQCPALPVLLMTTFEEPDAMAEALQIGVEGFLLKDVDPGVFICSLRALAGGVCVYHSALKPILGGKLPRRPRENPALKYGLTPRDLDMVEYIVQGLGNKEIAAREGCSEGVIKNRISSILNKMGLNARTQIAVRALREELV